MFTLIEKFDIKALAGKDWLRRIFLIYLLGLCATHGGVSDGVRLWGSLFCISALVIPKLAERTLFWLCLALVLMVNFVNYYEFAGNHTYLSFYTSVFFALDAYRDKNNLEFSFNIPRALLIIVFGFATLQKLLSAHFMSGKLLANYFIRGNSFNNALSWLYDGYVPAVQAYPDTFDKIANSTVLTGTSLPLLTPGNDFILLCQILTIIIVVVELGMFGAFAIEKVFDHPVMPLLTLGFVWGTSLFRHEYTFFTLLCILFLLSRPKMEPTWRFMFILSISILISFDIADIALVF